MFDDIKARKSSTMMRRSSGRSGVTWVACGAECEGKHATADNIGVADACGVCAGLWVGLDLRCTLLQELQSLAGSAAMSAKWQLAHDFGDLRHMREMARPSLVDVLLQLLLDRGRRALRQRGATRRALTDAGANRARRWRCTTSAIDFSNSHVRRSGGMLHKDGSLLTSASLLRPCFAYKRAKPKKRCCCRAPCTRLRRHASSFSASLVRCISTSRATVSSRGCLHEGAMVRSEVFVSAMPLSPHSLTLPSTHLSQP